MPCHDALPCTFAAVLDRNLFVTLPFPIHFLNIYSLEESSDNYKPKHVHYELLQFYLH